MPECFFIFVPMAGIYIHIPFCRQACHYCDFHFSTSLKNRDELLQALHKEIMLQREYFYDEVVETIYFGGGTPSLLSATEVSLLIDTINRNFKVDADAEITLEANPDDLDTEKLIALKQTPVNRLSIGVQSFFDEDLVWMNRAHRATETEFCIKAAQDAGFNNLTVDLIYGYPLLSDQKWQYNLQKVFALRVPHISAYAMTVEPRTALASFINRSLQPAMNDTQSAGQFIYLMNQMEANGFEHYEISNFCRPGQYSRHNSSYWQGVKYLGIGPSAHSYDGQTRQWNIANNNLYIQSINGGIVPFESEVLSSNDRLNEYVMTALRTMWGLDLQKLHTIKTLSGEELLKAAGPFFESGWIKQKDQLLTLTQTGKLYADHIASQLFF